MEGLTVPQPQSLSFHGRGAEYFRIWIVNLVLTVLTLGIYSAWAKVRTKRYFLGNTRLGEDGFDYHATPMMLLKGRLIALALAVLYLVLSNVAPVASMVMVGLLMLVAPWIIWRSHRFNALMTSFRNVRFDFDGTLREAYEIFLWLPFLPLAVGLVVAVVMYFGLGADPKMLLGPVVGLSILFSYLLTPHVHRRANGYLLDNLRFGDGAFSAELSSRPYYGAYIKAFLGFLLAGVLVAVLVGVVGGYQAAAMRATGDKMAVDPMQVAAMVVAMYLVFIVLGLWFKSYLEARLRNYALSRTRLDEVAELHSDLRAGRLFRIQLSNLLLLLFTLGLAWPWAVTRLYRYRTERLHATVRDDLGRYVSERQRRASALGEEMGDVFDVGGLGF